jgi:hypothetical protein
MAGQLQGVLTQLNATMDPQVRPPAPPPQAADNTCKAEGGLSILSQLAIDDGEV